MMHKNRRWTVAVVATVEVLAKKLTENSWCVCNGWRVEGRDDVVFLNDATGPDGAQEYAVCRREADGNWYQIESITFSWCNEEEAEKYIRECLAMAEPPMHAKVTPRIETHAEHVDGGAPMCCA